MPLRKIGVGVALTCTVMCAFVTAAHAYISNGADAIDALGQYDDSLTDPQPIFTKGAAHNAPNRLGVSGPLGRPAVDYERRRLFMSDTVNNRIFVYDLNVDHTFVDRIPDYVLGQVNFYSSAAATTADGLSAPTGLTVDAATDRLFVADRGNNRIVAYDVSSLVSGMSASLVIGQIDLTTAAAATTAGGLRTPSGIFFDEAGDILYVADRGNNRVLAFSGSLTTGMNAWKVLGQSSFTASGAAATRAGLNGPTGVTFGSGQVFVADRGNSRVLMYTGAVLADGMDARTVLGQTTFTASGVAVTQGRMREPESVAFDSATDRLFVADSTNHRVLVFSGSLSIGMNAWRVLGKTVFTSAAAASTQIGLNGPKGVMHDSVSNRLFVTQETISRASVFDVAAITNGENAADLLGQYDDSLSDPQPVYTKTIANDGPNRFGMASNGFIHDIALDHVHHRLFVPERDNNRVLVYELDANNELVDRIADNVLGQANFYSRPTANTAAGFNLPSGVAYDPNQDRLFVSQASNRISVFDTSSITDGMNAAYVLGQTNFTTISARTSRTKLSGPTGMDYDAQNDRLFVADSNNQRIVMYVFTGGFIQNGLSGSNVFGQPDFSTAVATTTQSGVRRPFGVAYDPAGDRLFVSDSDNSRILTFNFSSGITDGMNASNVFGWSDFTSSGFLTTSLTTLAFPLGIEYDRNHDRLFVTQGNRVLGYDMTSVTDGQTPTVVLGQSDFDSAVAQTTIDGMNQANSVVYDHTNDRLYVIERTNNRVTVFDAEPAPVSSSSSSSSSSAPESSSSSSRATGGGGHRSTQDAVARATVRRDAPAESEAPHEAPSAAPAAGGDDNAGDSSPSPGSFNDVPAASWFSTDVQQVIDRKIFSGYETADGTPTGEFGPADPVTIGQLLKVALLTAGAVVPIPSGIPANPTATDWSVPYVALAESLDLTFASSDVRKNATRGEVIATLLEASGIAFNEDLHNDFADLDPSNPHAAAILTAAKLGLVTGDTDVHGNRVGTVRPDDDINRAEVAVLIVRFLGRSGN